MDETLTTQEIVRLLNESADLIETDGWYNPRLEEYVGQCPLTAISQLGVWHSWAFTPVCMALESFVGIREYVIPEWNDAHDEPAPVVEAMRECAYKLSLETEF